MRDFKTGEMFEMTKDFVLSEPQGFIDCGLSKGSIARTTTEMEPELKQASQKLKELYINMSK